MSPAALIILDVRSDLVFLKATIRGHEKGDHKEDKLWSVGKMHCLLTQLNRPRMRSVGEKHRLSDRQREKKKEVVSCPLDAYPPHRRSIPLSACVRILSSPILSGPFR